MKITVEWLHAHKTPPGGWTRKQLAAIGVAWPPRKGWLRGAVGREITQDEADAFEAGKKRAS